MKGFYFVVGIVTVLSMFSCDSVPESYEGVLITNCGQNGMDDYKIVVGRQYTAGACTYLRVVPMFSKTFDMAEFIVYTNDGGTYTVDPSFSFQARRGKSREIVYNYNNFIDNEDFLNAVAESKLSLIIKNAYVEQARTYSTDSLMKNVASYEKSIEFLLKAAFNDAYFELQQISSNVKPPKAIADALLARNKMKTEQETMNSAYQTAVKQAELDLLKARNELEIAKIQTQVNLEKSRGLNEMLLRERMIEGWIEKGCPMPTTVSNFPMWNSLMQPMTKQ